MSSAPETQMTSALKAALNTPAAEAASAPAPAPATATPVAAAKKVAATVTVKTVPTPAKTAAAPAAAKKVAAPAPAEAAKPAAVRVTKEAAAESKTSYNDSVASALAKGAVPSPVVSPAPVLAPHLVISARTADEIAADSVKPQMVTLEVYGSGCLACPCLIANDADLEPLDGLPVCHFSRGQKHCPAEFVQVKIVGQQRRAAEALRRARDEGNTTRFTRLMAKLSGEDSAFQEDVLREAGILQGMLKA